MSKRPWMPLYIGDYIADTTHLSVAEHGCYLLLIMHYWQHGSIPNNDEKLCLICRCRPQDWSRHYKKNVLGFFQPSPTGHSHVHLRIDSELARADEISNKRKAAAQQMLSKRSANADTTTTTVTKSLVGSYDSLLVGRSDSEDKAPGERPVLGNFDFVSDDGTVVITAEEFAKLEQAHLSVKNIRGLVRHACRSWLTTVRDTDRKRTLFAWLAKRDAENAAKGPRVSAIKPTTRPAEYSREAMFKAHAEQVEARAKRDAWLARKEQREREKREAANGSKAH